MPATSRQAPEVRRAPRATQAGPSDERCDERSRPDDGHGDHERQACVGREAIARVTSPASLGRSGRGVRRTSSSARPSSRWADSRRPPTTSSASPVVWRCTAFRSSGARGDVIQRALHLVAREHPVGDLAGARARQRGGHEALELPRSARARRRSARPLGGGRASGRPPPAGPRRGPGRERARAPAPTGPRRPPPRSGRARRAAARAGKNAARPAAFESRERCSSSLAAILASIHISGRGGAPSSRRSRAGSVGDGRDRLERYARAGSRSPATAPSRSWRSGTRTPDVSTAKRPTQRTRHARTSPAPSPRSGGAGRAHHRGRDGRARRRPPPPAAGSPARRRVGTVLGGPADPTNTCSQAGCKFSRAPRSSLPR